MTPFTPSLSLAAVAVVLFAIFGQAAQASPIEEHKRQKLIPFPRVGKRQALIPFPRTGKRQSGWLIPFPRTGKRSGPGAPGPPGAAGTVADFLQQLEREREEAAHSQPTLAGAGGAASMKDLDRYLESARQPKGRDDYAEYEPMTMLVPALRNLIRRIEDSERMN